MMMLLSQTANMYESVKDRIYIKQFFLFDFPSYKHHLPVIMEIMFIYLIIFVLI